MPSKGEIEYATEDAKQIVSQEMTKLGWPISSQYSTVEPMIPAIVERVLIAGERYRLLNPVATEKAK